MAINLPGFDDVDIEPEKEKDVEELIELLKEFPEEYEMLKEAYDDTKRGGVFELRVLIEEVGRLFEDMTNELTDEKLTIITATKETVKDFPETERFIAETLINIYKQLREDLNTRDISKGEKDMFQMIDMIDGLFGNLNPFKASPLPGQPEPVVTPQESEEEEVGDSIDLSDINLVELAKFFDKIKDYTAEDILNIKASLLDTTLKDIDSVDKEEDVSTLESGNQQETYSPKLIKKEVDLCSKVCIQDDSLLEEFYDKLLPDFDSSYLHEDIYPMDRINGLKNESILAPEFSKFSSFMVLYSSNKFIAARTCETEGEYVWFDFYIYKNIKGDFVIDTLNNFIVYDDRTNVALELEPFYQEYLQGINKNSSNNKTMSKQEFSKDIMRDILSNISQRDYQTALDLTLVPKKNVTTSIFDLGEVKTSIVFKNSPDNFIYAGDIILNGSEEQKEFTSFYRINTDSGKIPFFLELNDNLNKNEKVTLRDNFITKIDWTNKNFKNFEVFYDEDLGVYISMPTDNLYKFYEHL